MLPPLLRAVARLVGAGGLEVALAIGTAFGGQRQYLADLPPADHPLCQLVGRRVARLIAASPAVRRHRQEDSRYLRWPSGKPAWRWLEARRLRRQRVPVPEIARRLGLTPRRVEQICAGLAGGRAAGPTPSLCPVCRRRRRGGAAAPAVQGTLPLPLPEPPPAAIRRA